MTSPIGAYQFDRPPYGDCYWYCFFFCQFGGRRRLGREHWSQEKEDYNVGIHWPHGLGDNYIETFEYDDNDASDEVEFGEDDRWPGAGDEDEDEDNDATSDLNLEDEPNANVGDKKRSHLRIRTN
jgi:hypothetical protein